jgi:hypothetical protein
LQQFAPFPTPPRENKLPLEWINHLVMRERIGFPSAGLAWAGHFRLYRFLA